MLSLMWPHVGAYRHRQDTDEYEAVIVEAYGQGERKYHLLFDSYEQWKEFIDAWTAAVDLLHSRDVAAKAALASSLGTLPVDSM